LTVFERGNRNNSRDLHRYEQATDTPLEQSASDKGYQKHRENYWAQNAPGGHQNHWLQYASNHQCHSLQIRNTLASNPEIFDDAQCHGKRECSANCQASPKRVIEENHYAADDQWKRSNHESQLHQEAVDPVEQFALQFLEC
jgi:hypothetical protein